MKKADILKSLKTLLCVSLEVEQGPCPKAALLFPGCTSPIPVSPPFLLATLATIGICPWESREGHGGWSLFPVRNRGQKGFRAQKSHRVLLGVNVAMSSYLALPP